MESLPLNHSLILAIESSCDDMAAAVLRGRDVLSSVVASQSAHAVFGGVVPEIASRAHLKLVTRTVQQALEESNTSTADLSAICVTRGPGLPGSLIVGNSFARAFADGLQIPLIGVNHLEGHIYSVFLGQKGPPFPFLTLIVSGGHTQLVLVSSPSSLAVLGSTRDDAAGEAYDKVGKLLGLGYPAGPEVDRLAADGDPNFYRFPRTKLDSLDFSFSGIKTSVLYFLNRHSEQERKILLDPHGPDNHLADICASFQEAAIDMLLANFEKAIAETGVSNACIVGGVSANSLLRSRAKRACEQSGTILHFPEMQYCTDNAAMIGVAATMSSTGLSDQDFTVRIEPNLNL